MNTKKDEPGTKETPGAAGPGSNRPHATIDLKATVVDPKAAKEPTKEAAKDDKTAKEEKLAAVAASSAASPKGTATPGTATPRASTISAGAAQSTKPKPGAPTPDQRERPQGSPSAPQPFKSAGSGGFFTHLAAGIAGGVVALLAADFLASQLGLSGSADQAGITTSLQQRIEALESHSKGSAATTELASRLKAAEAKVGKLDGLNGKIDKLSQAQGALSQDVKSLDAKVGAQGGDADTASRLTKLEDKLSALSEAAAHDPQGGLPQLAAVTGKITDLESTVNNQLDALRKSVTEEIDTRLAAATADSEAAKSGTQRIDRDLASIKADDAQVTARINALTAESQRAGETLRTTQEELTRLKVDLNARLPNFARAEDVSAATTPLAEKLNSLQKEVQGVVKGEEDRKATAEHIVLSLELANLKRAIDRGGAFAPQLAAARKLSDGTVDLAPLASFADTGVPTLADLRQDFKSVAFRIIDAGQQPADGSIMDRLLAGAKSVVRVRKISHESDDRSVEAVVARMEAALKEDRLGDVVAQAKTLPPAAQDAASDFLAKVEARNTVDKALASVEGQLKASLVAPAAGAAGTAKE
jgi:hypothetical protein